MIPSTAAEAIALGLTRYFTGKPCLYGHVAERLASLRSCTECSRIRNRAWVSANAPRRGKWMRQWQSDNAAHLAACVSTRKAVKLQRTPLWADSQRTDRIYVLAKFATDLTGVEHHVDHVLPLQGETVSGLHVHGNLQVLPGRENVAKSNRFTPYAEAFSPPHAIALIDA